ncbi:hypothetical protein B9K05_04620 [Acetobacter syzygii]|uniref:Uncharacterized protein n=1 Tax=Acetobacter syzygii TaxID=146476 RepID=A0A270BQM1_9PROT|nr:hypothetical protein B9K05_04620 [Acetobacter syzygii]
MRSCPCYATPEQQGAAPRGTVLKSRICESGPVRPLNVWSRMYGTGGWGRRGEVAPCRGGLWRYVFSLLLFAVYPKADRV